MTRVDLISHDPTDDSLRTRLATGVGVIREILYQVNWAYPTIKFADDQINAFKEIETENTDIFRKASGNIFDHTELTVSVSLFKGMSHCLHACKQALLKEELEENARDVRASSCIQLPGIPGETVTPEGSVFKNVLASLEDDRCLVSRQKRGVSRGTP